MALLARVAAGGVRRRVRRLDRWPSPTSIHYYHFDGLGSVIALTNSSGSVVNLYEYSVYGEVSASDPNHPNRFLFTGREFDKDTGLYYYRARYYNPYIGRFLQTDPAGDGMNWYAYCSNNPTGATDPSGMASDFSFSRYTYEEGGEVYYEALQFNWKDDIGNWQIWRDSRGITEWINWARGGGVYYVEDDVDEFGHLKPHYVFPPGWERGQIGWFLSMGGTEGKGGGWFWGVKGLMWLDPALAKLVSNLEFYLRAYPNKPAQRYVMMAQTRWSSPR